MFNPDSINIIKIVPTQSESHRLGENQYDGFMVSMTIGEGDNAITVNKPFTAPCVFDWEEEEDVCGLDAPALLHSFVDRLRKLAAL